MFEPALLGTNVAAQSGGVSGSTWDNTFNPSVYTLSGANNLIATRVSGAGSADQMLVGTLAASSGYFEIVVNSLASGCGIGVSASAVAADFVGDTTSGIGFHSNGNVYHTGVLVTTLSSYTVGDIIGTVIKAGKLYFSKNATWLASMDPSAGTGGIDISSWFTSAKIAVSTNSSAAQSQFTLRAATGFTGTIPTGSAAWG